MRKAYQREAALFDAVMDLPPEQRAAHLEQACGGDAVLRRRMESLLRASESRCEFLDSPGDPELRRPLRTTVPLTEKPGDRIGRYKLLEQIGEGGCGVVYVAEQTDPVRRRVALKIIKLGMDTKSVIARFEAERQALALMDHSNIAKVLDAGATETGRPYFVMELVRGMRITEFCDETSLSPNARLDLFIQVCQAIQHAHQKGIIHRDIKPSNILVTVNDGVAVPKVIDFGVAKATGGQVLTDKTVYTAFEQFIGTPAYMSPEQAVLTSLDIDTRSDIYALGVLLYELMTGRTPFDPRELLAIGLDEMRRTIREEEPERPSTRVSALPGQELSTTAHRRGLEPPKLVSELRSDLDWIVMKCLEKDRARRYETASGLVMDIQRHLDNEPVVACPPSRLYRLRKTVRRNKLAFAAASAVAASLVIGLTLSTVLFIRERAAREQANEQAAIVKAANLREQAARERAAEQAAIAGAVNHFLQSDLLRQASTYSQAAAQFTPDPNLTVREALERAAERIGDRFKDQPLQEAAVRMAIGEALAGVGEYGQAEAQLRRAFELRQDELGPDHPATLRSRSALAFVFHQAGKVDLALPLFEETLKRMQVTPGPDHPDTLNTMNSQAGAYLGAGKLDQALLLYEETLKLTKAKLGPDHRSTLSLQGNLATIYAGTGKFDQALPLFEETLKRMRVTLGPGHPRTLVAMGAQGSAYLKKGKLDQAQSIFEETVRLQKATHGPDHPATLKSRGGLALAYARDDKLDQALPLFEETLKRMQVKLGPDHPDTLRVQMNLALNNAWNGKLDQAFPHLEKTLRLIKDKLGPDHPTTLKLMNDVAYVCHEAGWLAEAEELLAEVEALLRDRLAEVRQRNPGDPAKLVGPANDLVKALLRQNEHGEAEELLDEVLAGPVRDLPEAVELLHARGRLRARRGKWKEATSDLVRVRQVHPEDHVVWHELAALLAASGQVDVYREHCRKSAERFSKTDDPPIARRIVKDCLILPDSGVDLEAVAQMADTAAAATNHGATPWFQLVKGLADYRQGRLTKAVEWLNKTPTKTGVPERQVAAYMVLAMAHYQLKQPDEARAAFDRGAEIERTMLPKLESGEIGDKWIDWIIAHALMHEAKALIEGGSSAPTTSR